jgi:PAS domain S-box-containing protein
MRQATMSRDPEQQGELRRTAELAFSVLGSLSGTSILVFDSELRYVLAGGGALTAHGYQAEELEGRHLSEFVEGPAYERLAEHYQAALDGEHRRFEHRTADGTKVYDIDVAPIERDGAIAGGLAISRDITERKQTERALAHSAREYRDLAEQASDVVSRSDEAGVYTYVSPASARVYDRAPDEMLGRSVFEFMHPDDHEAHRKLRAELANGADELIAERRMSTPAGDWVWVEARCRALRDDDGRFTGVARHLRPQDGR